jgi:hypothetical protein
VNALLNIGGVATVSARAMIGFRGFRSLVKWDESPGQRVKDTEELEVIMVASTAWRAKMLEPRALATALSDTVRIGAGCGT